MCQERNIVVCLISFSVIPEMTLGSRYYDPISFFFFLFFFWDGIFLCRLDCPGTLYEFTEIHRDLLPQETEAWKEVEQLFTEILQVHYVTALEPKPGGPTPVS